MDKFPWLNVKFEHTEAKPGPVALGGWLWWALRLLALFAGMRLISELLT